MPIHYVSMYSNEKIGYQIEIIQEGKHSISKMYQQHFTNLKIIQKIFKDHYDFKIRE